MADAEQASGGITGSAGPTPNIWSRRSRKAKAAIIGGAILLALILIGALAPSQKKATTSSGGGGDAQAEQPTSDPRVGDTVELKGTSYRVTSATTATSVGRGFTQATASGVFIVVRLDLTNKKNRPATILADNIRIYGGNGKLYTVDTDAFAAFDNGLTLLQDVQPDLTKQVTLVYDVPQEAVSGAKLQVVDAFSNDYKQIDLGL